MSFEDLKEYKLKDVANITTGFAFKGNKYTNEGTRVLRGENVTIGSLRWDTIKCWNEPFAQQEKYSLRAGDIVIGMDGSRVGKNRAQIRDENLPLLLAQRVACIRSNHLSDQNYLAHIIKSKSFEKYVAAVQTGTSIPHISQTQIEDFVLELPSIERQSQFASILSSLDDKIELNRQINQTLEAIAQAIFKEWFVDFNFPSATDELVDDIPIGWSKTTINAVASNIQYGYTQSSTQDLVGPKFLRITDIQGGMVDWPNVPYCKVNEKDLEKYRIKERDIFIARTGASTGENIYIINPPIAVFASYLIRVQFPNPALGCYIGKYLRSKDYFEYVGSILSGSAQPNANAQQLTAAEIILPEIALLEEFFKIINPLDLLKAHLSEQNQTLIQIRESLLPKLMNGEICMKG